MPRHKVIPPPINLMPRKRARGGREFPQEQPSATIPYIPVKKHKPFGSTCSWDFILVLCVVFSAATYTFLYLYLNSSMDKLIPIQVPEHDPKLWGTYRAHNYFGLRTRSPQSPLFGMMWYEQPETIGRPDIRHWCRQEDNLPHYAWYEANGRSFGKQNISDLGGNFSTDWVSDMNGGFSARIKFNVEKGKRVNVILYLVSLDSQNVFQLGKHLKDIFSGDSSLLGSIKVSVQTRGETVMLQSHSTLLKDYGVAIDRLHDQFVENMQVYDRPHEKIFYTLNGKTETKGKLVAVQLNFGNSGEFEIGLATANRKPFFDENFDRELQKKSALFNKKYETTFGIADKNYSASEQKMGKIAISNMLGSIGYWNGYNRVMVGGYSQIYGPHTLFSAVPSRPFFPRGFLWDEGFHLMLIRKYDPKLALEIIVSWMNLMDTSGWIPREVILGTEAEARVPYEFWTQHMDVANPPSIFYVIEKLMGDPKVLEKYGTVLAKIYPRLEKWFLWLRSTQFGSSKTTFRWRGRNSTIMTELNPKTLPSGLDDFPRATHPSDKEYHLDLRCWLALCARVMERLSKLYGSDADHRKYSRHMEELNDFDQLMRDHWSEKNQGFFDFGRHSEEVALTPVPKPGQAKTIEYQRVIGRAPTYRLVTNVYGYVNLFPMMFKMLPPKSLQLRATLNKLRDPKQLWSDYGIRSISVQSPYYMARNTHQDAPYWRGYIWINMNYMILSALKHYAGQPGPYAEQANQTFLELRANLVHNMAKQLEETGYMWENYCDKTGAGHGSHPFNGWSSLILMIMSDDLDT